MQHSDGSEARYSTLSWEAAAARCFIEVLGTHADTQVSYACASPICCSSPIVRWQYIRSLDRYLATWCTKGAPLYYS